jgi:hypothetical protein
MLALIDDVVTGGTHDLSFLECWRETLSDIHITGRYSRHVPAWHRRTPSAMAAFTDRLGVDLLEINRLYVASLATALAPVWIVLPMGWEG